MSIATDEAEKYFPTQYWPHMEPNGEYRGKECYIEGVKSSDIQEAYEQGRTAEPTDAEIEAGAIAIFSRLTTSAHHMSHDDYVATWHCIAPEQREEFMAQSKAVLEAARKAVTGDERGY